MLNGVRDRVLPAAQRRTLAELTQDLDLFSGDSNAKRSAFWTMLTLSSVIATAGVITDSTATVIGAMIIAPLSTPIMGIALGAVQQRRTGAIRVVLLGCLLVIAMGMAFSFLVPETYDVLANDQIASRTSPGLLDLVAALATGLAGAVALARRDVAAVLPGVAIAISLVPPLVVTGVCLGRMSGWLALGALVLFLSNLFALVFGGMVIFAALGYRPEAGRTTRRYARRTYLAMSLLFAVVFLPLAANTAFTLLLATWTGQVKTAAEQWLQDTPTASVTNVNPQSRTMYIYVQTSEALPPIAELLANLDDTVPTGVPIVVETTQGQRIDAGTVGR